MGPGGMMGGTGMGMHTGGPYVQREAECRPAEVFRCMIAITVVCRGTRSGLFKKPAGLQVLATLN
jgi:hypothetical protein